MFQLMPFWMWFFFIFNLFFIEFVLRYYMYLVFESSRGIAWWQMAWDLHSRSRVRVRTCTSCKSLGQHGFYSLTWTHKVRFPGGGVSSNPKKKFSFWKNYSDSSIIFYVLYKLTLFLNNITNMYIIA